jgi:hypothetical protein
VERVLWSIEDWPTVVFVTATIPEEEHDPRVISKRWTVFIKQLKRRHYRDLRVIRVLQKFPGGHGWHIHALLDRRIHHKITLPLAEECGLGRMDFKEVKREERTKTVEYLVRYITRDMKDRWKDKALKGVRILTASGNLNCAEPWWRRLSDLTIEDACNDARRVLQRIYEAHMGFVSRNWRGQQLPLRMQDMLYGIPPHLLDEWQWECAERQRKGLIVGVTPKG